MRVTFLPRSRFRRAATFAASLRGGRRLKPDSASGAAPRPATRSGRGRHRGQSLLEFAIVVPVLLALVGVTLDFARVYQVWMKLQAVTRDTAEYLATDNAVQTVDDARDEATIRICTAMAGSPTCPGYVRLVAINLALTGTGQPIWSATVGAEYDFQTTFLYPIVRGLTGADRWVLGTNVTFEILRRESP